MIIGEHGSYPRNAKGQTLYPRYEFFQQVVDVFRKTGKTAAVFNDKHLSWNWDWARVDGRRLARAGLPVPGRLVAAGDLADPRDRDAPRREDRSRASASATAASTATTSTAWNPSSAWSSVARGARPACRPSRRYRGDPVWKVLAEKPDGAKSTTRDLFDACLCRSFRLTSPLPGYGNAFPDTAQLPGLVRDPILYRITYNDGLIGNLFMMNGLVSDFTVALQPEGDGPILSTQLNLPGLAPGQTLPNFFSPLARHCETMFVTGKPPYPVERTLLTSGILHTAVNLLASGRTQIDTPHLRSVAYQPPRESQFMRS